jgi:hypothetical protein
LAAGIPSLPQCGSRYGVALDGLCAHGQLFTLTALDTQDALDFFLYLMELIERRERAVKATGDLNAVFRCDEDPRS